jgi:predicted 3-demethylubiquinone-9 3-methyltransferase (glyoxalase superfamily)
MKTLLLSTLLACAGLLWAAEGPQATTAMPRQKITTFLWFDDDAEEAVRFYTSLFPDSRILEESRWGDGGPLPKGTLMSARFRLAGQELMALNGGPLYHFSEAISLLVDCADQDEIDRLWAKLTADGGEPGRCGWLKDKYGLSWQIVPTVLGELIQGPDPVGRKQAVEAMLQMQKLDIAKLQQAYDRR